MYFSPDHTWPQPSASPPLGGSATFAYLPRSGRFGRTGIFGGLRRAMGGIGSGVGLLMTSLAGITPPPPPPPPSSSCSLLFLECLPPFLPPPPPPLSSSSVSSLGVSLLAELALP